jgi:hypothetical protein
MYSVIRNVSLGMILGLGLIACGDDDKTTMTAPAAATPATPASGGGEASSAMKIEKAEGVVYQDEIYANWPYN